MLKFRTMVQDAIALDQGRTSATTRTGTFPTIRASRAAAGSCGDEPRRAAAALNVLRGEMSLVGPRADIVEQVANYDRRRPAAARRAPGITGWAQVNGRDAIPWPKRFELDAWYIEHWSLSLDAKIVVRTSLDALPRAAGARSSTR